MEHTQDLREYAFIIGNGLNRCANSATITWKKLAEATYCNHIPGSSKFDLLGFTNTEIFDLIIAKKQSMSGQPLRSYVVQNYSSTLNIGTNPFIKAFANKLDILNVPVLSTNYDGSIESALGLKPHWNNPSFLGKSTYYPMNRYYAKHKIDNIKENFGVWHIHGEFGAYSGTIVPKISDSIRLSSTDYLGLSEKIRDIIYQHNGQSLTINVAAQSWKGKGTWLEILFEKPLYIIGWGAGKDEFILRWLLLWRYRYMMSKDTKHQDIFVCCKKEITSGCREYIGKINFFRQIGFDVVETDDYCEQYEMIIGLKK